MRVCRKTSTGIELEKKTVGIGRKEQQRNRNEQWYMVFII